MAKDKKRDKQRSRDRAPPLRWAWSQLMPASTRGTTTHKQRIYWKGIPQEGDDPLLLAGMELCVAWTPDPDDRTRELIASAIVLKQYLARYPAANFSGVFLYDYSADLLQVVDPSTEYGRMLAHQRFRGIRDDSAGVTIRPLRLRLAVGDPPKAVRQLFRQRTKCGRFPHGIELPSFTVVDPPQMYADDCTVSPDGTVAPGATGTAQPALSDLEVDRLWEFAGMAAEWLLDRAGNRAKRVQRREETRLAVESARAAENEPRALVESLTAARDAAVALEARRVEELAAATTALKEGQFAYQRERGIANSAVTSAENDVRRLEGVYRKEFRLLTDAYHQHGDGSPEHTAASTRVVKAKAQWDAAPAKVEAAKKALPPIEARWTATERRLSAAVQQAEANLRSARSELEAVTAKLTEASAALKLCTDATALAVNFADDYASSL